MGVHLLTSPIFGSCLSWLGFSLYVETNFLPSWRASAAPPLPLTHTHFGKSHESSRRIDSFDACENKKEVKTGTPFRAHCPYVLCFLTLQGWVCREQLSPRSLQSGRLHQFFWSFCLRRIPLSGNSIATLALTLDILFAVDA